MEVKGREGRGGEEIVRLFGREEGLDVFVEGSIMGLVGIAGGHGDARTGFYPDIFRCTEMVG